MSELRQATLLEFIDHLQSVAEEYKDDELEFVTGYKIPGTNRQTVGVLVKDEGSLFDYAMAVGCSLSSAGLHIRNTEYDIIETPTGDFIYVWIPKEKK